MSQPEEDYSALGLQERWTHSKWNVRQGAYKEAAAQFKQSSSPSDECFGPFVQDPGLLKSAAIDTNAAALDAGIQAIAAFLEFGDPSSATPLRKVAFKPMAEKGLASIKPAVKLSTADATLLFIETSDDPRSVIEDLTALLSSKLPKLVAATAAALTTIYKEFGVRAVPPEPVLKSISKLFAHTDRNVRAEGMTLAVVLYRWLGRATIVAMLDGIKPVQMRELEEKFTEAESEDSPQATRFLRSQQPVDSDNRDSQELSGGDVEMAAPEIDPYDLMTPIDVISKIPADHDALLSSSKWKERKEALDATAAVLDVPKIKAGDFSHLTNMLVKIISKDANVMCATQAIICVKELALGLRSNFATYATLAISPLVERFKEKKASVIEAVSSCLLEIYHCTSLRDILPSLLVAHSHKVPQVKIESLKFLNTLLSGAPVNLTFSDVEEIAAPAVKLMGDNQAPVREEAAKLLGTLLKITGERRMNSLLLPLDDIRKSKIKDACQSAQVNSTLAENRTGTTKRPTQSATTASTRGKTTGGMIEQPTAPSRIASTTTSAKPLRKLTEGTPSKKAGARTVNAAEFTPARLPPPVRRRFVSPAKVQEIKELDLPSRPTSKSSQHIARTPVRVTRELINENSVESHLPESISMDITPSNEVRTLRREKMLTVRERDAIAQQLENERSLRHAAEQKLESLHVEVEALRKEVADLRSKEVSRAKSQYDLHNHSSHIMDTVNTGLTKMSIKDYKPGIGATEVDSRRSSRLISLAPPRTPGRVLHNGSPNRETDPRVFSREKSQENWRRAAEVTSELKKRIEDMKRQRAGYASTMQ